MKSAMFASSLTIATHPVALAKLDNFYDNASGTPSAASQMSPLEGLSATGSQHSADDTRTDEPHGTPLLDASSLSAGGTHMLDDSPSCDNDTPLFCNGMPKLAIPTLDPCMLDAVPLRPEAGAPPGRGPAAPLPSTGVCQLPGEMWREVFLFAGADVTLLLSGVSRLTRQLALHHISWRFPSVVQRLPCVLTVKRGDAIWTLRLCPSKMVVTREGTVVASAAHTWVSRVLEWVEGLCLPGHISPARGSWAPLLSTSPPHPSSSWLKEDLFATPLPPVEDDGGATHSFPVVLAQQTIVLQGPYLQEAPPTATFVRADPKRTSYLRIRNMFDMCEEIFTDAVSLNGFECINSLAMVPEAAGNAEQQMHPPPREDTMGPLLQAAQDAAASHQ